MTQAATPLDVCSDIPTYVEGPLSRGDRLNFPAGYVPVALGEVGPKMGPKWHQMHHPAVSGVVIADGFNYVSSDDKGRPWNAYAFIVAVRLPDGQSRLYGAYARYANGEFRLHFLELSELDKPGAVRMRR